MNKTVKIIILLLPCVLITTAAMTQVSVLPPEDFPGIILDIELFENYHPYFWWWDPNNYLETQNSEDLGTYVWLNYDNKISGNSSGEFFYNFTNKDGFIFYYLNNEAGLKKFTTSDVLQVFVYGDGSGNSLRLCVDDQDGREAGPWVAIDWEGWMLVSWDLSSGGADAWPPGDKRAGNGILEGPLDFNSIHMKYSSLYQGFKGSILVDNLRFVDNSHTFRLDAEPSQTGGIYACNEDIKIDLTLSNFSLVKPDFEVEYEIKDYTGGIYKSGSLIISAPRGEATTITFNIGKLDTEQYDIKWVAKDSISGAVKRTSVTTIAVLPPRASPGGMDTAPRNDKNYFGIMTHFNLFRGDIEKNLNLVARAGASWIRDGFSWDRFEVEKGVLTIPGWYKSWIREVRRLGIEPVIYLAGFNYHYITPPDRKIVGEEALNAWSRYVRFMVKRFQGIVRYYEVWNEPNVDYFWQPKADPYEYFELMKTTYQAVKETDASGTVLGVASGASINSNNFSQIIFDIGGADYMDAYSFHAYSRDNPEVGYQFLDSIETTSNWLETYEDPAGPPMKSFITECGLNDIITGVFHRIFTPEQVADYTVREHVLAMEYPRLRMITVYNLQDDGVDPFEVEHHWGLLNVDLTPKPAYIAYSTMTWHLNGTEFIRRVNFGDPDVFVYEFTRNNRITYVLWSVTDGKSIVLNNVGEKVTWYDLRNHEYTMAGTGGTVLLEIGESPIFLYPQSSGIPLFDGISHADAGDSEVYLKWHSARDGHPDLKYYVYSDNGTGTIDYGLPLNSEPLYGKSYTVSGLENGNDYKFAVKAENGFGNLSEDPVAVSVRPGENLAAEINPGFEEGGASRTSKKDLFRPTGWSASDKIAGMKTVRFYLDGAEAYSGRQSLRVDVSNAPTQDSDEITVAAVISDQALQLQSGHTYEVGVRIKRSHSQSWRMLTFKQGYGIIYSRDFDALDNRYIETGWELATMRVTIPNGTGRYGDYFLRFDSIVRNRHATVDTCSLWLDDIYVKDMGKLDLVDIYTTKAEGAYGIRNRFFDLDPDTETRVIGDTTYSSDSMPPGWDISFAVEGASNDAPGFPEWSREYTRVAGEYGNVAVVAARAGDTGAPAFPSLATSALLPDDQRNRYYSLTFDYSSFNYSPGLMRAFVIGPDFNGYSSLNVSSEVGIPQEGFMSLTLDHRPESGSNRVLIRFDNVTVSGSDSAIHTKETGIILDNVRLQTASD